MKNLKELRLSQNLTTTELGKKMGCSNPTITHYEKGDREPSIDMLCKLADYFNVSVDYLIGHETKKNPIMERPLSDIAENFIHEYSDYFTDKTFQAYVELYKYMDERQKIFVIGMIVGYLKEQGIPININF